MTCVKDENTFDYSYEGDWVNGKENGKGVFIYASGNTYDGEWENGNFISGCLTEDGIKYDCEYKGFKCLKKEKIEEE